MNRLLMAGVLCLTFMAYSRARADVIFDLEDVTVTPGAAATVGVFVSGSGNEFLDAYDLPIDIGNNAFGLPAGITGFSVVTRNSFATVLTTSTDPPPLVPPVQKNFDAVFSDGGTGILLSSTPRRLFDLVVTTDGSFTGTTPISIFSSTDPSDLILKNLIVTTSLNDNGTPVPGSNLSYKAEGSIGAGRTLSLQGGSITAVPEASSLAMLGLLAGAVGFRRRR